ncbi:MAG TPA: molybdopterin adenylyltransferase [Spirochaetota bacterium]|nr:molybdopterin adenylyltransferase [Spirochaetota bacterium]HNT09796.1 molybdopterin adenylyltransferase [Spirochaetota bacterium]HNV46110.1 molybdopterin adenylyltransferase [Spirochaetota bacterium]HOS40509.1 molybdopterin adenylyltransferase [Spirochaetota bacterium]HPI22412.1 molybdopterin adenylyltransferase [Spirochaetota bacterium]
MSVGVITVSDRSSRGEREDASGPAIREWAEAHGYAVARETIVPDERDAITRALVDYSDAGVELILTTGGTGFAPRDVTPEATCAVIDRPAPGFAEAMRAKSLAITPHAMLSRAASGIRKRSLIINLPGSPKAVRENLGFIEAAIPHAIELLRGEVKDCGTPPSDLPLR